MGKKTTPAKLRYMDEYDKLNTTKVLIKLNNVNDADVIEKLASVDNKQGYIKSLIRADIKSKS